MFYNHRIGISLETDNKFFPYKEEVTGSNPVAPTGVFEKLPLENTLRIHITHTKF